NPSKTMRIQFTVTPPSTISISGFILYQNIGKCPFADYLNGHLPFFMICPTIPEAAGYFSFQKKRFSRHRPSCREHSSPYTVLSEPQNGSDHRLPLSHRDFPQQSAGLPSPAQGTWCRKGIREFLYAPVSETVSH